jgi:DNA-directed RNA polymerase specialized sigma24 family protein
LLQKSDCLEIEINRNYNKWRQISIRLLKDKQLGEDMLQDVLIKLISSDRARMIACEQERKGSLFYYVNKILWNETKDRGKKPNIEIVELTDEFEDEEPNENNYKESLDAVMCWLTDYQIELLTLKQTKGFSIRKLSKATNIGAFEIHRDLKNAVEQLKKYTGNA